MRAWLVSSRASIDQATEMKEDSDLTSDSEDNTFSELSATRHHGRTNQRGHGLCERVIMIPRLIVDPHKHVYVSTDNDVAIGTCLIIIILPASSMINQRTCVTITQVSNLIL